MAPRRGPKRPNDDDERPNKRAAKASKKQPTYDTYDEALDGEYMIHRLPGEMGC
jgi:hypothetical protein